MKDIIIETLKRNRLFAGLNPSEMEEVSGRFRAEPYDEGDHIFLEGESSTSLCIAAKGRVKIVKHTDEGKDVILEIISPPEIFGGVAVLDGRAYPASAQAMDKCEVISLSREEFLGLIDRFHVLAVEASIYFGERLRNAYDMLRSISVERVERRIASLLLRFGERIGQREADEVVMDLGLTMQEIAEMVGTTVETTIRSMNKFRKEGLIDYSRGQVRIFPKLKNRFPSDI